MLKKLIFSEAAKYYVASILSAVLIGLSSPDPINLSLLLIGCIGIFVGIFYIINTILDYF